MKPSSKALERRAARSLVATPAEIPPLAVGTVDAARLLGVSERYVRDLANRGELPFFELGSRKLYRVESLAAYVAAKESEATAGREQRRDLARRFAPPVELTRRRKAG